MPGHGCGYETEMICARHTESAMKPSARSVKFAIPGEPQGKARPRVVRRGSFTKAYTPEKTVSYENLVRLEFERQCEGFFDKGIPLRVTIIAHFVPPSSTSKRKFAAMLQGLILPNKKPDCDNIGKIVCDALNGLAYYDDAQIVEMQIVKRYATMPRVDVEIAEVIP